MSHTKKNGTTAQGKQQYRCKKWGRQFLFCLDYTYHACNPLYRKLIVPMTLNGSGVRDIARVLHISPTTILAVLRAAAEQTPEPRVPPRILDLEVDEQWSFVQNKMQQCSNSSTTNHCTRPPTFRSFLTPLRRRVSSSVGPLLSRKAAQAGGGVQY
jgi:hypothetical protein